MFSVFHCSALCSTSLNFHTVIVINDFKAALRKILLYLKLFFFNFNNMSMNIMYTAQKETSDLLGQEPILRELTKKLVSLILL